MDRVFLCIQIGDDKGGFEGAHFAGLIFAR